MAVVCRPDSLVLIAKQAAGNTQHGYLSSLPRQCNVTHLTALCVGERKRDGPYLIIRTVIMTWILAVWLVCTQRAFKQNTHRLHCPLPLNSDLIRCKKKSKSVIQRRGYKRGESGLSSGHPSNRIGGGGGLIMKTCTKQWLHKMCC